MLLSSSVARTLNHCEVLPCAVCTSALVSPAQVAERCPRRTCSTRCRSWPIGLVPPVRAAVGPGVGLGSRIGAAAVLASVGAGLRRGGSLVCDVASPHRRGRFRARSPYSSTSGPRRNRRALATPAMATTPSPRVRRKRRCCGWPSVTSAWPATVGAAFPTAPRRTRRVRVSSSKGLHTGPCKSLAPSIGPSPSCFGIGRPSHGSSTVIGAGARLLVESGGQRRTRRLAVRRSFPRRAAGTPSPSERRGSASSCEDAPRSRARFMHARTSSAFALARRRSRCRSAPRGPSPGKARRSWPWRRLRAGASRRRSPSSPPSVRRDDFVAERGEVRRVRSRARLEHLFEFRVRSTAVRALEVGEDDHRMPSSFGERAISSRIPTGTLAPHAASNERRSEGRFARSFAFQSS